MKEPFIDDKIKLIKDGLKILDLASQYSELSNSRGTYIGDCPLCNSLGTLYVHPKKNTFKCYRCGNSGDTISFVKCYENLTFTQSVDFLYTKFINSIGDSSTPHNSLIYGDVYVLILEGLNYYIGFTQNFEVRIQNHFSGAGAVWTKKHKPIEIVEKHESKSLNFENILTEQYIQKFGYERVRGGDHAYFSKKYGGS